MTFHSVFVIPGYPCFQVCSTTSEENIFIQNFFFKFIVKNFKISLISGSEFKYLYLEVSSKRMESFLVTLETSWSMSFTWKIKISEFEIRKREKFLLKDSQQWTWIYLTGNSYTRSCKSDFPFSIFNWHEHCRQS